MSRILLNDKSVLLAGHLKKFKDILLAPRISSFTQLNKKIKNYSKSLHKLNEPYLNNLIKYCFSPASNKEVRLVKEIYLSRIQHALKSIKLADDIITDLALKKLPKRGSVFVYGGDAVMLNILHLAKKNKHTNIITLASNKSLINQLKKGKLNFHVFPDISVRMAVKNSDVVLLGCDAITRSKIIYRIGSEHIAEIAARKNIPVYVCSHALNFTETHKMPKQTFLKKGCAKQHKYEYERIDPDLVAGIISEMGIYDHAVFMQHLKEEMPWVFTSFS